MKRLMISVALTAALWLAGCGPVCKPLTHRCLGCYAQLCDGKGKRWRTVMDCSELKPKEKKWRCVCEPEGRCGCKPTVTEKEVPR